MSKDKIKTIVTAILLFAFSSIPLFFEYPSVEKPENFKEFAIMMSYSLAIITAPLGFIIIALSFYSEKQEKLWKEFEERQ